MNIVDNLYKKFIEKRLPLSDQLAAARSILANERTFLSYQRTALTFAVAGISFIKFFEDHLIVILGWTFLPAAVVSLILGIIRYVRMRDLIRNIEIDTYEKIEHKKQNSPFIKRHIPELDESDNN